MADSLLLPSLETQVQDKVGKREEEEEAKTVMLAVPDVTVKHSYARKDRGRKCVLERRETLEGEEVFRVLT